MIKICQQCNQPFTLAPKAGKDQKFCSHSCYAQSMITKVTKICEQCGKTFQVVKGRKDDRRFCSRTCMSESRITRVTKICEQCGKTFEAIQSFKDRRFCSTACAGQHKVSRIEKICASCGKTFEVTPARKNARYCSIDCQMAKQKKKVELTCTYCGKTFYEKRSHAHYRQTCSRYCQALLREQQGRSAIRNHTFTDEERKKIGNSVSQYYQDNPEKHNWYVDGAYVDGKLRRGPSWQQQRKAARQRDDYTCRICGITEAQIGKQLSVHHKIPYRKFASSDEANVLDNLITACQSCHMKLEHNIISLPLTE